MHKKTVTSKHISDVTVAVHDRFGHSRDTGYDGRLWNFRASAEHIKQMYQASKGVTRMHRKVVAFFDRANQKADSLIPQ